MNFRHERVLSLWSQGYSSPEIALKVGYKDEKNVLNIILKHRKMGDPRATPRMRCSHSGSITRVPVPARAAIAKEAAKRGVTPHSLAQTILVIVAADKLFDAVLGDHAIHEVAA